MSALTLSILTETYPGPGRAHAIGTWASIGGLGFGASPVAGGILLSFFGWSSVFWVNVPIGAAGFALAAVAVAESPDQLSRRLDVPGISHVAMRDVPSAVSGAASGVLNASRQVGTSVGLAVLGAIGTGATVSDWTARVSGFPAAARAAASGQAQNVAGARVAAVTGALGPRYRDAAVQSFVHGYHLAVGVGAACLLAAALIAFIGLRTRPANRQPGTPTADARLYPDPGQGVRSGQS